MGPSPVIIIGGKGNIRISSSLTLSSILHVPNMSSNLLFAHNLKKKIQLLCNNFYNYVIQYMLTRTPISGASEERHHSVSLKARGM